MRKTGTEEEREEVAEETARTPAILVAPDGPTYRHPETGELLPQPLEAEGVHRSPGLLGLGKF